MIQMETILGFDPLSKEIKVFEIDVTPSIAQYILIHHNKDNRKVTNSQINKIAKSIREDGWLRDGQPLTFNVDGNITEGQHRLNAIVAEDVTVPMIIVLGVELNCFTNTAPAKPRRPEDEIQRKDKSAKPAEVSTLRQLLKRRQGVQLSMKNAISQWEFWQNDVRSGLDLVDEFFDQVSQFDAWKRTFAAWSALMISIGEKEAAENLLDMVADRILRDPPHSTLSDDFIRFLNDKFFVYGSNAGRTEIIFNLLCVASDRVLKKSNGEIQLNITPDKLNHTYLKNQGVYRKFLENVDNNVRPIINFG
jgi:hypothetical protein|tara:strand:+ start:270 stop:1187 length:918 start_codon:yes stop_codon:yes gene_type:complete